MRICKSDVKVYAVGMCNAILENDKRTSLIENIPYLKYIAVLCKDISQQGKAKWEKANIREGGWGERALITQVISP